MQGKGKGKIGGGGGGWQNKKQYGGGWLNMKQNGESPDAPPVYRHRRVAELFRTCNLDPRLCIDRLNAVVTIKGELLLLFLTPTALI
jgi:hypothetical protein